MMLSIKLTQCRFEMSMDLKKMKIIQIIKFIMV